MAKLLIGYDVEYTGAPEITHQFLRNTQIIHGELEAPCTFFMVGKLIEEQTDAFAPFAANPLYDFQQHTYSHMLLKTVYIDDGEKITVMRGGTLEQIDDEVGRTCALLKERFNVECLGICGPWCYYRGLSDRPDILEILHKHGIRFTRTYGRNEKDWQPVDMNLQPFTYQHLGFPDVLEFPVQGWQDCVWRGFRGWADVDAYKALLKEGIDAIAGTDRVWDYCTHDWSSLREDPDSSQVRYLIEYARSKGVEIQSYLQYYKERVLSPES